MSEWLSKNAAWVIGVLTAALVSIAGWAFDAGGRVTSLEAQSTRNAELAGKAVGGMEALQVRVVTLEVTAGARDRALNKLTGAVEAVSGLRADLASMAAELRGVQAALQTLQRQIQIRERPGRK